MEPEPADIARRAAKRIGTEQDRSDLTPFVEAELQRGAEGADTRAGRYGIDLGDAAGVASAIITLAGLAWTIYRDLRRETPNPSRNVLTRRVRITARDERQMPVEKLTREIEIVVEETFTVDDDSSD